MRVMCQMGMPHFCCLFSFDSSYVEITLCVKNPVITAMYLFEKLIGGTELENCLD